jgi:ATP-dependent Clp protease, protease subunit
MNLQKDFTSYAKSNGISGLSLHQYQNFQSGINANMTPYILEERQMNMTALDVFSRLMAERIIWLAGPVDDGMSTVVQAQLMYLDSVDSSKEITLHIDTPGGSVKSGLSIVDVMDYIKSDVRTINTGMAYSMGSVLLGAGTKGKRNSLRFSKTMMHNSSGQAGGNISDARITFNEWEKVNTILFELLGGYCGKDPKEVEYDASRDKWLTSQEALEYGIIDEIIIKK